MRVEENEKHYLFRCLSCFWDNEMRSRYIISPSQINSGNNCRYFPQSCNEWDGKETFDDYSFIYSVPKTFRVDTHLPLNILTKCIKLMMDIDLKRLRIYIRYKCYINISCFIFIRYYQSFQQLLSHGVPPWEISDNLSPTCSDRFLFE